MDKNELRSIAYELYQERNKKEKKKVSSENMFAQYEFLEKAYMKNLFGDSPKGRQLFQVYKDFIQLELDFYEDSVDIIKDEYIIATLRFNRKDFERLSLGKIADAVHDMLTQLKEESSNCEYDCLDDEDFCDIQVAVAPYLFNRYKKQVA